MKTIIQGTKPKAKSVRFEIKPKEKTSRNSFFCDARTADRTSELSSQQPNLPKMSMNATGCDAAANSNKKTSQAVDNSNLSPNTIIMLNKEMRRAKELQQVSYQLAYLEFHQRKQALCHQGCGPSKFEPSPPSPLVSSSSTIVTSPSRKDMQRDNAQDQSAASATGLPSPVQSSSSLSTTQVSGRERQERAALLSLMAQESAVVNWRIALLQESLSLGNKKNQGGTTDKAGMAVSSDTSLAQRSRSQECNNGSKSLDEAKLTIQPVRCRHLISEVELKSLQKLSSELDEEDVAFIVSLGHKLL